MDDIPEIRYTHDEGRYGRQLDVWGKIGQQSLFKSSVVVVGSGPLSHFTSASLTAFGVGNLYIIDNESYTGTHHINEYLFSLDDDITVGEPKVKSLERMLSHVNTDENVNVEGIVANPEGSAYIFFEDLKPDVIIDVTNNPNSKNNVLDYCNETNTPLISASTNMSKGRVRISEMPSLDFKNENLEEYLMEDIYGVQGNVTSGVIAGVITEELKNILFRKYGLPQNARFFDDTRKIRYTSVTNLWSPSPREVNYNLNSMSRFSRKDDFEFNGITNFRDTSILMLGAGSLGNYVGLNLALMGVGKVIIIDDDVVDSVNLSRQYLLYDSPKDRTIGRPKAEVLKERLKKINPFIDIETHITRVTPSNAASVIDNNVDVMVGCTDNWFARNELNLLQLYRVYTSGNTDLYYIDGGTSYNRGQMIVHIPGYTPCLSCAIGAELMMDEDIAMASRGESRSCTRHSEVVTESHAPTHPGVIMSNMIIGSLIPAELHFLVNDTITDKYISTIYYTTHSLNRFNSSVDNACDCHRNEDKLLELDDIISEKFEEYTAIKSSYNSSNGGRVMLTRNEELGV